MSAGSRFTDAGFADAGCTDSGYTNSSGSTGSREHNNRSTSPGRGSSPWQQVRIDGVVPVDWSIDELQAGIRELERLRREADAAMALLVGRLPESRDGVARLARVCRISNREARNRHAVAKVVSKVAGALSALASGSVSAEHVAALAPIAGLDGAEELLALAASSTPEELQERVEQHRISLLGPSSARRRQQERRTLRFFNGPEGMVGLHAMLPPEPGLTLQQKLAALVDARWREKLPERAAKRGAYGGDSHDQRMVDALLEMTGVADADPSADCLSEPSDPSDPSDSRKESSSSNRDAAATSRTDDHGPHDSERTQRNDCRHDGGSTEVGADDNADNDESTGHNPAFAAGKPSENSSVPTSLRTTRVTTAKPAVVIVFDVARYEATLLGRGPIPVHESLFDEIQHDLYLHFQNSVGEVLKFDRARREPTLIQKLAVLVRDKRCQFPGCTAPPEYCEIHHFNEWLKDQGLTNVELLGLMCRAHHRHVHLEDLVTVRHDGYISIFDRQTKKLIATTANLGDGDVRFPSG